MYLYVLICTIIPFLPDTVKGKQRILFPLPVICKSVCLSAICISRSFLDFFSWVCYPVLRGENMKILQFALGGNKTNGYLVFQEDGGECFVIDPGAEAQKLYEKIQAHSLRVKEILLTHGHFDHIMAVDELRNVTGAGLAMHASDACMLQDGQKSYALPFAGRQAPFHPPSRLLQDGDKVSCEGVTLTVMHTPGHTPGSVCYGGDGVIFTGDTLFAGSVGRCDLWGGDEDALINSLSRFHAFPAETRLYPGHGSSTSIGKEIRTNPFLCR